MDATELTEAIRQPAGLDLPVRVLEQNRADRLHIGAQAYAARWGAWDRLTHGQRAEAEIVAARMAKAWGLLL